MDDATPEQLEAASSDVAGKGSWVTGVGRAIPVRCDLETDQDWQFEDHMAVVHGFKSFERHVEPWRRTPTWVKNAAKPWKYRPAKNPKPYEQKPMEPGAHVTWTEHVEGPKYFDEELGRERPYYEPVQRSGEVWSLGAWPKSVWVVPDQPWRDELAVLLQPWKGASELRTTSTSPRKHLENR